MPKPIKLPTWATGSTSILEPSDGKKAQGWVPGEQPPASIFNYWQNLVHEWITWLDANGLVDGGSLGDLQVNGTLGTTGNTTIGTDGDGANLQVNGTLGTTGLATVAGLQVNGTLNTTGQANVTGDVKATGLYGYTTPPTRTKAISVAQGGGSSVHGQYRELAPGAEHVYVVNAPHGATLGAVRLKLIAFSGGAGSNVHYTVRLMRRHAIDFSSTGVPTHAIADSDTETLTAGPSAVNRTRSFGGLAVSKDETYEVALMCESDSGAGCALRILALDYSFVDPGPRNH
jgi:hypothetical protein